MSTSDIISDQAGFARLCVELSGHSVLALDTEFMRERTYFAQLCLLQISFGARAHCIDALALADLSPLRPTLAAQGIRKVLHAARQDLEVLWPATGAVRGLFDTQAAAALIGLPAQIGYGELVRLLLGRSLHKTQTRTDWSRRPLTSAQLAYALDDVRYLPALSGLLSARLEELGRWQWFEEEMAQLCTSSFQVEPDQAWRRIRGIGDLDESRRELARALAAWRERRASSTDQPRNWVLPDAALRDIVTRVPRSMAELQASVELPERIRHRSGEEILSLIESLMLPPRLPALPQRRRPPPAETEAVRRLAELAQQTGRELGIAPEILVTRREMERLVGGARDGPALAGWRRAVIGERLLSVL